MYLLTKVLLIEVCSLRRFIIQKKMKTKTLFGMKLSDVVRTLPKREALNSEIIINLIHLDLFQRMNWLKIVTLLSLRLYRLKKTEMTQPKLLNMMTKAKHSARRKTPILIKIIPDETATVTTSQKFVSEHFVNHSLEINSVQDTGKRVQLVTLFQNVICLSPRTVIVRILLSILTLFRLV